MNEFKYWLFSLHIVLIAIGLTFPSEFLGYIISAIIVGTNLFYLKNGIMLLFVVFPVRPFMVEVNGGLAYLADFIILTSLCVVLVKKSSSLKYWITEYRWLTLVSALLAIGLFSGLYNGVSFAAGIFQIRSLLITFFLLIIGKEVIWSKVDLNRLILISIGTALVVCVHGWIEKLSLRQWLLPASWKEWNLSAANEMRIYGLIANPNVLATYLLIIFFSTFLLRSTTLKNWHLIIIRTLIAGTALLTYSRGAMLAFATGVILFIILKRAWRQVVPLLLYVVLSFTVIYYPIVNASEAINESGYFSQASEEHTPDEVSKKEPSPIIKENNVLIERFKEMFSSETVQASAEWGRIYVVLKGVEIFTDHPLFGTGFSTYGDAASQTYKSPIYEKYGIPENLYADNQYISLLVSTGLCGVILAAILMFLLIKKAWSIGNNQWRSISLSAIAVLLTAGLFYNILEDKTFTLYFYFLMGYVLNNNLSMENRYEMD
ncbi:O-antigen ligase [Halobacillus sp. Marseille-P3879]|uniref:O-antigen ligase family protein n=1 Tax=Halobacillus sp. Marseille-P3879 TaxID=2045014 RepID=UPI0013577F94|nr:O-antigen ligase family protein [Halobacillus sp. Marseille-P3879]